MKLQSQKVSASQQGLVTYEFHWSQQFCWECTQCLAFSFFWDWMWLQILLDRTWSWQLSCYCGRGPSNDGGGRRRGGQWFGWFASCRSGQLRLNGSNGLTRRDLESQTRWNSHSHVPAWQSVGLVSQTQTQTERFTKRRRQKDGRNVEMRLKDVGSPTSHFSYLLYYIFNTYFLESSLYLSLSKCSSHLLSTSSLNPKPSLWLIFSTFGD